MLALIPLMMSQSLSDAEIGRMAAAVLPSPRQAEYRRSEFIGFVHFGVNTFTGREWGTGMEDPAIFNPSALDADQWCREAKAAGMTMLILTAKHHDGFCLWPSRYTQHSVASSPWRGGRGDVMRELAQAAARHGLKLGVYLSPADLYQIESPGGYYGNLSPVRERVIPRPEGRPFADKRTFRYALDDYNEYFMNQLFELLTEYGPIHEVWLDGAKPKDKGNQQYAYSAWYELVRELAPQAVIFGRGPDVRWCGNEAGDTRAAEWSVVPIPSPIEKHTWPDMMDQDLGSIAKLRAGLARGETLHYYPAETDTSIREGWFWRDEKQHVKPASQLFDIYERSVGGNSVLLLNFPPNREGLFPARDIAETRKLGEMIRAAYATENSLPLLPVRPDGSSEIWEGTELEISLANPAVYNRLALMEPFDTTGERIERFSVELRLRGEWAPAGQAENVGYKRILRFPAQEVEAVRIRILSTRAPARLSSISLHLAPEPQKE